MPVHRGRRITDARPQAAVATAATTLSSITDVDPKRRSARRVSASGVAEVEMTAQISEPPPAPASLAEERASMPVVESAPRPFKLPAALLQRMQQFHYQPIQPALPEEAVIVTLASSPASPLTAQPPAEERTPPSAGAEPAFSAAVNPSLRAKENAKQNSGDLATLEEVSEAEVASMLAAKKVRSAYSAPIFFSTTRPAAGTAAETQKQQQWRRQQLLSVAQAADGRLTHTRRSTHHRHTEVEAEEEERRSNAEAEDTTASPFGDGDVIKFGRSEDGPRPFGGRPQRSPSSGSSSSFSSSSNRGASGKDTAATEGRQAQHQRVQEARARRKVRRHLSGYDRDFLEQQEARLLHNPEEEEEEENADMDGSISGSESGLYSSGNETECEEEEEGNGDGVAASGSDTVSYSGSSYSSHSGGSSRSSNSASSVGSRASSTATQQDTEAPQERRGFGPMNQLRQQQAASTQHRQQVKEEPEKISNAAGSLSTSSGPASSPSSPTMHSRWLDSLFFATHENRLHKGGCHHTLIGLRGPVTISGPCGLIGFGLSEVAVNGFYLGCKQLNLWNEEHRAVLLPVKKLKTKHAQDTELPKPAKMADPVWRGASLSVDGRQAEEGEKELGFPVNPTLYESTEEVANANSEGGNSAADREWLLHALQYDSESVFGTVDWDWVEVTVQYWRSLFADKLPPIFLVIQATSSTHKRGAHARGPMRRFYLNRKRPRGDVERGQPKRNTRATSSSPEEESASSYFDVPAFVAHRVAPSIDAALLPSIVPAVAGLGCGSVVVLGSSNIGKSTLCRFLANALLSQHGLCYWLDLDVGQPEFGVSGQLALYEVRRPLLRPHDAACVRQVAAYFTGANTAAACPVTSARAVACLCAQAAAVARVHPVVVNTHGWVLQTGRRVTVEALRRLRPREVVHLVKHGEEAWAANTAALLDSRNGLNADVVQRRFMVSRPTAIPMPVSAVSSSMEATEGSPSKQQQKKKKGPQQLATAPAVVAESALLGRQPYADESITPTASPSSPLRPVSHTASPASPQPSKTNSNSNLADKQKKNGVVTSKEGWRGHVHTVRVVREETYATVQQIKATKGGRGRQKRWQDHLAPVLHHYALPKTQRNRTSEETEGEEEETTLLEAPLRMLHSIVLAERDEKAGDVTLARQSSQAAEPIASFINSATGASTTDDAALVDREMHADLAAALEHAVVAVLFHTVPNSPHNGVCAPSTGTDHVRGCVVRSLAALPGGFPISCYGVLESSEQELLYGKAGNGDHDGWFRLRVPLRPSVVAQLLAAAPAAQIPGAVAVGGITRVSIAYSSAQRQDTSFLQVEDL